MVVRRRVLDGIPDGHGLRGAVGKHLRLGPLAHPIDALLHRLRFNVHIIVGINQCAASMAGRLVLGRLVGHRGKVEIHVRVEEFRNAMPTHEKTAENKQLCLHMYAGRKDGRKKTGLGRLNIFEKLVFEVLYYRKNVVRKNNTFGIIIFEIVSIRNYDMSNL
jgi:hypothetical protein